MTAIVKHHTCNKQLINAADSDGYTPIMVAAMKGALDCAAVLLKEGADADARKRDGTTALYLAVSNGHQHCAQALVDAGANVDVRRKDGANALVIAATMGRNKCVQLLLEAGCPLDAADEDGTAIENARMQGHRDCELLLREARDAAAAEAKRKKELPGDRPGEEDEDEGSEDGGGDAADDDNESGDGDGDGATGEEAEEEEEAVPLFALSQLPADELATALESLRLRSAASAEMVEKFEPPLLDMLERLGIVGEIGPMLLRERVASLEDVLALDLATLTRMIARMGIDPAAFSSLVSSVAASKQTSRRPSVSVAAGGGENKPPKTQAPPPPPPPPPKVRGRGAKAAAAPVAARGRGSPPAAGSGARAAARGRGRGPANQTGRL